MREPDEKYIKSSFFSILCGKILKNPCKKRGKYIDRSIFLAYNITMEFGVEKKGVILQWTLRIFLTAACVAMLAFIFSNSLKTGEKSAAQSSTMVDVVQNVASVVAPNSGIATATGDAYDRLHSYVRIFAHFIEFAAFGALLLWCVSSYTWKKEGLFGVLIGIFCVPIIDEDLQHFVAGRGAQFSDVCLDISGGVCGMLCAVAVLLIILGVRDKRRRKREQAEKMQ